VSYWWLVRALAIVFLALFAAQAGGLALGVETTCYERCADDGPDGECAPTCADCLCCAQPRAPAAAPRIAGLVPPPAVTRPSFAVQAEPAAPDPAEILRVPKPA
jgi:hypothetical protein